MTRCKHCGQIIFLVDNGPKKGWSSNGGFDCPSSSKGHEKK